MKPGTKIALILSLALFGILVGVAVKKSHEQERQFWEMAAEPWNEDAAQF